MRAVVAIVLVLLVGCGSAPHPAPGPVFSEILRDAVTLRSVDVASFGPSLHRATFERLQRMTRAQAMSALQADGFDCAGITCRFENTDRVTRSEAALGVTQVQGPYSIVRTWEITFLGDPVTVLDDLAITASSRIVASP